MPNKNILLLGGAGYVGTVLTSHLLKKGYKITAFDNFTYENEFSIQPYLGDPNYNFIKGDITNENDLHKSIQGITDVVLLAGLVGDPITKKYPEASKKINSTGIKNCINFLNGKGLNRVIFISTCSNYGLIGENELADEEFKLNPLSLYATAKVEAENQLLSLNGKADFTGTVLRFATAFGLSPRMRFDLTVNEFTRDLYFGKKLVVYDEQTWRPYCHLRDFARLIEMVLEADKDRVNFEVFNAGGDINNFTKKMIVDEILRYIPDGKVVYNSKGSDPRNYKVSFKKVEKTLGFGPKFTIEDGIHELVKALGIGVYADSMTNTNKYGNFQINYDG
ncbi:MAG: NAD(P)-dependent oxidoreductase [Candidatus Paceibacterota bacterium]